MRIGTYIVQHCVRVCGLQILARKETGTPHTHTSSYTRPSSTFRPVFIIIIVQRFRMYFLFFHHLRTCVLPGADRWLLLLHVAANGHEHGRVLDTCVRRRYAKTIVYTKPKSQWGIYGSDRP